MEALLDFSRPLDVALLDNVVRTMFTSSVPAEQETAHKVMVEFQAHPDAWTKVVDIVEQSQYEQTKFLALKILEDVINTRWNILPREIRDNVKTYIQQKIIDVSSNANALHSQQLYINKFNETLIALVKQEWPHNWPTFLSDIVSSANTDESLCENNMHILMLLSEEVFDFSSDKMTTTKIRELKNKFNQEFTMIYELCENVLQSATKESLIRATLKTLHRFLNWIPLGYIFETKLLELLVLKFLPATQFQCITLECLSEVVNIPVKGTYNDQYFAMYNAFCQQLDSFLPLSTDFEGVFRNGSEDARTFLHHLALFFSNLFRRHNDIFDKTETHQVLLMGLEYLVHLSKLDERELFKICVDFWNFLSSMLFQQEPSRFGGSSGGSSSGPLMLGSSATGKDASGGGDMDAQSRRVLYAGVLSKVREVLISRMAKPEEVLVKEDENGHIVRVTMKDNENTALYRTMREALVFLTHLDCTDTERIMLAKLKLQVTGAEWSWQNLNTLCWAVGSISGAMMEEDEKGFLVHVIKDLLHLCEQKRGKDNKAVVASNIMYVVGQYPRFLRAHWRFLKTVVCKLFEFMHESHPGVQDMAVDTFLRIVQKCKRKFVIKQIGEPDVYLAELISNVQQTTCDLEPQQVHVFYEAVGHMLRVCDNPNNGRRDQLLQALMEGPNQQWQAIMAEANSNVNVMTETNTSRQLVNILRANVRVASSMGQYFMPQMGAIYLDLLQVYKVYSEMVTQAVASQGPQVTKWANVKAMMSVKREILLVLETFIEGTIEPEVIARNFVPPLLDPVLGDYQRGHPLAREAKVLSLFAVIVDKLGKEISNEIPRLFESVFECTLEMITQNMCDYPEHRLNFFNLIRRINERCFGAFFSMPEAAFKLVIDSIVWAFKHTERNISETGLRTLLLLLQELNKNAAQSRDVVNAFYQAFFAQLLQDILYVLTDSLHKPGLDLQCSILMTLCHAVENGTITAPLDPANANCNNREYVRQFISQLLSTFATMNQTTTNHFINSVFDLNLDAEQFRVHIRDFLVTLKQFGETDNSELFEGDRERELKAKKEEEQQRLHSVPGLLAPHMRNDWENQKQ